jgi:hypothetical protein
MEEVMGESAELAAFKSMGAQPLATMPGNVEHLAVIKDRLWAACTIERRWWEFWKPSTYIRWVDATHYCDLAA